MQSRALCALTGAISVLLLSSFARAQDVDVPKNLTMRNSTSAAVGNILKEGVPFIHNYGTENTFLGLNAGNFTMTGNYNTGTGTGALSGNGAGSYNTAIGDAALSSNAQGNYNTATGYAALNSNGNGIQNTANGFVALQNNISGINNTATGAYSLLANTASYNTANGTAALQNNTIGHDNTAVGNVAFFNLNDGSFNTALGQGAGFNLQSGDGNIYIGSGGAFFEGHTIRIGDTSHERFFAAGTRIQVAGDPVCVNQANQLGICVASAASSDDVRSQQQEIHELRARLEALERAIANRAF